ncbi:unnamed protein product [Protopolystoma xenopodis]|uniref:Uncharacterized protein n=1 Tax=Protopolystoma xenopodis TaxID=117903 RepID=A0A3S5C3P1_9PLAT|nr:unnamed protein product [Protopolystoma xenopodis]
MTCNLIRLSQLLIALVLICFPAELHKPSFSHTPHEEILFPLAESSHTQLSDDFGKFASSHTADIGTDGVTAISTTSNGFSSGAVIQDSNSRKSHQPLYSRKSQHPKDARYSLHSRNSDNSICLERSHSSPPPQRDYSRQPDSFFQINQSSAREKISPHFTSGLRSSPEANASIVHTVSETEDLARQSTTDFESHMSLCAAPQRQHRSSRRQPLNVGTETPRPASMDDSLTDITPMQINVNVNPGQPSVPSTSGSLRLLQVAVVATTADHAEDAGPPTDGEDERADTQLYLDSYIQTDRPNIKLSRSLMDLFFNLAAIKNSPRFHNLFRMSCENSSPSPNAELVTSQTKESPEGLQCITDLRLSSPHLFTPPILSNWVLSLTENFQIPSAHEGQETLNILTLYCIAEANAATLVLLFPALMNKGAGNVEGVLDSLLTGKIDLDLVWIRLFSVVNMY